jgi:serine/threonine protein phosphatase 1
MAPTYNKAGNARAQVPDGLRVYAIGDIHGRADLLERLLARIEADFQGRPAARGRIVYLGDYVDRGPDSQGVIDILLADPPAGLDAVHLKGNHEDFLLRFADDGAAGETWLMNGGGATMASYGVTEAADTFHAIWHLDEIRQDFVDAMPAAHVAFFRALAPYHVEGDYLFVHAGIRPGIALERQSAEDMMWIRDDFLRAESDFGHVVVHGHSARPDPVERPNRIGIDTMAYRSGRLTALALEGTSRRYLATQAFD